MTKIANRNCRHSVENKRPFTGSNLHAEWLGDFYIVYSYGWYPILLWDGKEWFANADKRSSSTSRQLSYAKPYNETIQWISFEEMSNKLGGKL